MLAIKYGLGSKMLAREIRKDPSVMAKVLDVLYENRHNPHGGNEVDN